MTDGAVRLRLTKVAMQPGKPQGHGTVRIEDGGTSRQVPVITLPGNPVSVLVSFTTVVVPALTRLAGHNVLPRPLTDAGARRRRVADSPGQTPVPSRALRRRPGRNERGPTGAGRSPREHDPVGRADPPAGLWLAPCGLIARSRGAGCRG